MIPLFDEHVKALWEVGFVTIIDFIWCALMLFGAITAAFWCIFGSPTVLGLLVVGVVLLGMFQGWLVLLLYRCLYFIIKTRADINMMPTEAARLAQIYQAGGKPVARE
jgi:hypothetical protein